METIVGNAIQRLQDCQRKTIVSLVVMGASLWLDQMRI
jgi:hypothetical protein